MPEPAPAPSPEFNLCGVLVHARPRRQAEVRGVLAALPGVEVHAALEDGRLVVTVEDAGHARAADTLSRIHRVEGVLSAALVYHHCERLAGTSPASPENAVVQAPERPGGALDAVAAGRPPATGASANESQFHDASGSGAPSAVGPATDPARRHLP